MAITTTIGAIISQGDGSLGLDEGSMGWGHGVFHGSYIDIKDNHKKNPYHNDKQIEIKEYGGNQKCESIGTLSRGNDKP